MRNVTIVQEGLSKLLPPMAAYVCFILKKAYDTSWWEEGVLQHLNIPQTSNLPKNGTAKELEKSLDVYSCLTLMDKHWRLFSKVMKRECRSWIKELQTTRNKVAHIGSEDISKDDAARDLDTMARLCEVMGPDVATELRAMHRTVLYGTSEGSTAATPTTTPSPVSLLGGKLPSWREIILPHPDVSEGRYRNAEFAADLAQVARGEGASEYLDPVEFFSRTYMTAGIKSLLVQAVQRVTGKGGAPVIQLKTAFGGGKTHSMLALYHLMRGHGNLSELSCMRPVLEEAGVKRLPQAHVAVLVGTAMNPAVSRRPINMPGITINTLWGEMAAQLAASAGRPELYNHVKEADKKGISPGSEALAHLFDACGTCVVLMDELVAYARKLSDKDNLPAGTRGNFITFIQELTEAAKASKSSVVVASIPESQAEIVDETGQKALAAIEHTFGRMEAIWRPVSADEGFEVVRRRLFRDCMYPEAKEKVCQAFSDMYRNNTQDFPLETREADYHRRMVSCYPIHPEVFDRIYQEWATLENFQKTRGVLRLMAAVIHKLWMSNTSDPMIMPGSFTLSEHDIKNELTRYLGEAWNAIIDSDVDGEKSEPYKLEKNNTRYAKQHAATRVARTIMLGSAPITKSGMGRGLELNRIRLGVATPGESVAEFSDALNAMQSKLTYLYSNNGRYWYDSHPTLKKLAAERAAQLDNAAKDEEITRRLRRIGCDPNFCGIHICPDSSADVKDEQGVRMVVLRPQDTDNGASDSKALGKAMDILENRGNTPRRFRNTLAFLAPEQTALDMLRKDAAMYLAWNSIEEQKETLNLDAIQRKEAAKGRDASSATVDRSLADAYKVLLVPRVELDAPADVQWDRTTLRGGQGNISTRAALSMISDEQLVTNWGPIMLKMQLDSLLWKDKDYLEAGELWNMLCSYCYLPRLSNRNVLDRTICNGVNAPDFFAIAEGFDGKRYLGLKYNTYIDSVSPTAVLVRPEIAKKQLEEDARNAKPSPSGDGGDDGGDDGTLPVGEPDPDTPSASGPQPQHTPPAQPKPHHFTLSTELDYTRLNKTVASIVEEILQHINTECDDMSIRIDVSSYSEDGFSPATERTVTENCSTLKVEEFGFNQ